MPLPADRVYDGISLMPLIRGERETRGTPIGFLNAKGSEAVWMEDRYKLIANRKGVRLYDIPADAAEKKDLSGKLPEVRVRMEKALAQWKAGVMKDLKAVGK